jgi:hypothetical protein
MNSKMTKVEGMKTKPAGGVSRPAFGQNVQPTNASLVGRLGTMLSAIKHVGRPEKGGQPPFAK